MAKYNLFHKFEPDLEFDKLSEQSMIQSKEKTHINVPIVERALDTVHTALC